MKKKAVVIDAYSRGSYHEVINQAYLMMISELYEEVEYIADKSSCENIKRLLDKCNVAYDNVAFIEKRFEDIKLKSPGLNYLAKLLKVSFLNWLYYIKAPKNTDIFYNNNLFFATILITLFANKNKNIYDMCHNEMELIDPSETYSATTKLLSKYFRLIFNRMTLDKVFHFILLSPKMVDYFKTFISPRNYGRMYSIDHSYIRPENVVREEYMIHDSRVKIGIPGAITPKRGLDTLKKVLSSLTNDNICIYALSSCSEPIDDSHFVILNKDNKLLPFEQYNAYVQSMDAMLLLYDKDSYKLTASGAVLEAIWNEKPIIALHNMYFDYLFEKFGDMGVLCFSEHELTQIIEDFTTSEKCRKKCRLAKALLKPTLVKKQLKIVIENV